MPDDKKKNKLTELSLPVFVFDQFDQALSVNTIYSLLFYENVFGSMQEEAKDKEKEFMIKMYINSPGGYVTDLMAIVDAMNNVSLPVKTYCLGMAASCAAILFSSAKKGNRYIGKNSRVLLHQVSAGAFGHIEDVEIAVEEAKKMNEQIITILSKNTGKKKADLKELLSRDLWLNAKEAVEFGIADHILEEGSNEIKDLDSVNYSNKDFQFTVGDSIEKKLKDVSLEEKDLTIELKSSKEDENYFYFSGYAATFDSPDSEDDVMVKGAFERTLRDFLPLGEQNSRSILWQHDVDQVIGKATLTEDSKGLFFEARLPKDDTFVSGRVVPQLKNGSLRTMSFGFKTIERYYKDQNRHITDVELYEISVVTIACNKDALITSVKKSGAKTEENPLESVADFSRFLKESGFTKSKRDELVFRMKKVFGTKPPCNEPAIKPCNEAVKEIIGSLKASREILESKKDEGK